VAAEVPEVSQSETASTEQSAEQRDAAIPATTDRQLTALVFDMVSIQAEDMPKAIALANRWVDADLSSFDMVAVLTIGSKLTVLSDFTFDREKLRAALQSAAPVTETAAGTGTLGGGPIVQTVPEPLNDVRLRSLATVCNILAPIAQSKRVLYFSSGMRSQDADSQTELRNATDACRRARIPIYPVDARGIPSVPNPNPNGQGGALFRGR
jgi:VWFA-related protein